MEDKIVNLYVAKSDSNENPKKSTRKLFKSFSLIALAVTFLLIIFAIYHNHYNGEFDDDIRDGLFFNDNTRYSRRLLQSVHEENVNPTIDGIDNPWWDDINMENMPIPGESFKFHSTPSTAKDLNQDEIQTMTLNTNVTYYKPERTLNCYIEFDEDGNLDSNKSYIEILDDFVNTIHIDTILLAGAPQIAHMHHNCTIVPAVIVIDIKNDTENGILKLKIREAEMFDYIDEVDCDLTNISLIDSGIDYGEAQRVKKLAKYFGNDTQTVINDDGTIKNITFSNVTYEELVSMCQTFDDDGSLIEEFPMINGTCGELDAIDYFGQQYGIDSVILGDTTINAGDDDDTFGVGGDGDDFTRRRLFFKRIRRAIKRVVKKVVQFVKDVIDILRGDINKRLFDIGLTIDASKSYSTSGEYTEKLLSSPSSPSSRPTTRPTASSNGGSDNGLSKNASGSFVVNAGVDFHAGVHADLRAKYNIFSLKPSFDLFRLTIGGETHFKVYIDINIDGTVDISFEIANVERRKTFMLGPVPILLKLYSTVEFGIGAEVSLDFAFEFGYRPTSFEYGVEWTKSNGWKSIEKNMIFEPFKNFGTEDDESCLEFSITPFVEVRLGVVFYEVVDVFVTPTIELPILFEFPATCDNTDSCLQSPNLLSKLNMDFAFSMALGLEVGGDIFPTIEFELPLSFADIGPIPIIDELCFPMSDPIFTAIGFLCCGLPPPTPVTTTTTILDTINCDQMITETFGNSADPYNICWKKVMVCDEAEGVESEFRYIEGLSGEETNDPTDMMSLVPYAITIKIVPDNVAEGSAEFNDYAIYGKICQNPIIALNKGKELSFEIDVNTGTKQGVTNLNWWYANTNDALNRLENTCTNTVSSLTEQIYHACGNIDGIHIGTTERGEQECNWNYKDPRDGKSIAIYLGFDGNKENICDGLGLGGMMPITEE